MSSFLGNPPLPTDQGPLPAPDVPAENIFSPSSIYHDTINEAKAGVQDLKDLWHAVADPETEFAKLLVLIVRLIGELWIDVLKSLVPLEVDYNNALAALHNQELPIGVPAARDMAANELAILLAAIGSTTTANYAIPGSDITAQGEELWSSLIQPFSLWTNTADPRQVGSGFQNAQFLLKRALALSLSEYTLDSMKNLVGFGWMQQLEPLMGFIDRCINPSNVVRQSMAQAYAFLMKAPIQRDLNHAYPIKDLGVTALAKLYIRNAIDEQTYLDKCLDAGLDNTQAQQLILETAKLLDPAQIGDLLKHGLILNDDAVQQLKEQGYQDTDAKALVWWQTNQRFFTIQERVGNEAVTAWKKGNITQAQLESLLGNLAFTQDEIALLEIEGTFTGQTTDQKDLTASEVKALYSANLVDLDYVINFYTQQGYSADNIRLLILLDFFKSEERALKNAELIARIRVQTQQQLESAAVEAKKNETALADARTALAKELNFTQEQLGLLQSQPAIMDLLGISL